MDIVIPSLFGLFNSLGKIFIVCWFEEKIIDNVRKFQSLLIFDLKLFLT